jgi:uncharacterized repeat protein (TIGR01451 family)
MASGKSFLILVTSLFCISNVSLASMCAKLKSVSAGENHTLALMDNGTLWACGSNSDKQLGLGSSVSDVCSLKQVKGENGAGFLKNIVTYDAGWVHSLAADSNGTLWAWGTDDLGQLGNGPAEDSAVPIKVLGVGGFGNLSYIVYVSAGRSGKHSLAVDSNGYVYAWGYNYYGQCGINNTDTQHTILQYPYQVVGETGTGLLGGPGAKIIAVDAGVNHSLALSELSSGGFVWEWGANNGCPYPQKVPGVGGIGFLNHIVGISTCYHSVAVDSNGFVYEWYEWQTGNPYKVPCGQMDTSSGYLENIVEVSAGGGYSIALTSDGHVLWWSFGGVPQYVEDGEMETQSGLLEGIISISAGFYDHKLAVSERGYGWAWGSNNNYGKFGVGDTNPRPEPAQMLCAEVPAYIYLAKILEVEGDEPDCFSFDDYITYRITYGPNSCDHNNVVLTDFLPSEVDYVSSSPDGNYNNVLRTVSWNIGPLDANTPNDFVTLTVKVDKCAESDGIITNYCQIENDIGYSDAEYVTYLCSASSPNPTCGEIVDLDTGELNLTWCPGHFAADVNGHEVYFGTNFNDVNDANNSWPIGGVYKGEVNNPSYPLPLGSLDKDTTYYWRIDDVNTAHPDLRWRGGVWSFTTGNYLVVDNFESYADLTALQAVWKKGTTRALVYLNTNATYLHGGDQSMQFLYRDGSSPYYSEAYANTTDPNALPSRIGSNWSAVKLLTLYFYGRTGIDPNEPMYVKLTDGSAHTAKVLYDGAPNDLKEESWHEWNIPLTAFTDINLADVKKIAIGFGDGVSSPSINSYIYFDDIRLYFRRCIPGYYPAGDFDSDCVVDFYDFAIFALAWLTSSGQPNYNPLCDISALGGDGINGYDLARFCDDWLWQEDGETSMSDGFGEPLYALPPPQQPQIELQPEPEPQVQSAPEPLQPEPQPQLQPEPQPQTEEQPEELDIEEIKETIELLQTLLTDEQVKKMFIDEEGEQGWQRFEKIIEDYLEELKAQL